MVKAVDERVGLREERPQALLRALDGRDGDRGATIAGIAGTIVAEQARKAIEVATVAAEPVFVELLVDLHANDARVGRLAALRSETQIPGDDIQPDLGRLGSGCLPGGPLNE